MNLVTVPPSSKDKQTFLGRGALRLMPQNLFKSKTIMTKNTIRYIGRFVVILLLCVAIYCEFKLGNPFGNALLDIILAFGVFYIGFNDANKKNASLQNHLQELQKRIEQLEGEVSNSNNSNKTNTTNPPRA